MTTNNPPSPDQPVMWHYAINNQQFGPATREQVLAVLQSGQGAGMMVWREGMSQWLPVSSVPELGGAAVPPPVMPERIMPDLNPQDLVMVKRVKAAKQNCVTMFVIFVLAFVMSVVYGIARAEGGPGAQAGGTECVGCAMICGGIFAAIYFPLRWRVIMSLPTGYKVVGIIGGFGLIGLLLLGVAGAILGAMAAAAR